MNFKKYMNSDYLKSNPLCGIDTYKDELNLATGACTRRIKKLVLDGTENWKKRTHNDAIHTFELNLGSRIINGLCSHYAKYYGSNFDKIDGIYLSNTNAFIITDLRFTTPADFKSYLAQQYTNGTPVIVWYVLTEPTTETITVPSGLSGIVEGSLTQTGTPTPTNPIYPTANTVEQWFDINHYIMGTSTDTITTLPAVIYANDTTATVGLVGNMSQTGTPTPTTPIQPQECGERTGNLYNINAHDVNNGYVNNAQLLQDGTTEAWESAEISEYIPISGDTAYTFNGIGSYNSPCYGLYDENKQLIGAHRYNGAQIIKFTSPNNARYFRFTHIKTIVRAMMVEGEYTSYEPYGYKIPISSANTTTPVYLGEVETTRKIRKLVLDGTENWVSKGNPATFRYENSPILYTLNGSCYCSHFENLPWQQVQTTNNSFAVEFTSALNTINIRCESYSTVKDFKAFLAAQYASGTPVTVWYVLATPETGIVNEPLRKIGDYADEVSGITIPTIAGTNALSIGTTLQPSEVSVNYKGWHPIQNVHEAENGQWD